MSSKSLRRSVMTMSGPSSTSGNSWTMYPPAAATSPETTCVPIAMTLTTPHCPVAESLPNEVELRVLSVPGIRDAVVNLVWDPPWDPSKMSDEARLELGML